MAIGVMTWVWNHSRSRHGARLVLLAIADCASGDGGNAWPSNAELRRKSGLGERAVQSAIAELVKLGELEVRYNDGPGGCNRYRVIMGDPRNICTPAENAPPQKMRGSGKRAAKSAQASTATPAESAPPQIFPEPPQNLHPTPAESAPVTVLEPKANQHQKTSSSGGTRESAPREGISSGLHEIPDDFRATDAMRRWAHATYPGLNLDEETAQFCRYWRSEGRRKKSWPDAWQKWIADSHKRMTHTSPRPGRQQETDDLFEDAMRRAEEREARIEAN